MVAQAIGFFAPSVFWNKMNDRGGVDTDDIMSTSVIYNKISNDETRDRLLRLIRSQMHR